MQQKLYPAQVGCSSKLSRCKILPCKRAGLCYLRAYLHLPSRNNCLQKSNKRPTIGTGIGRMFILKANSQEKRFLDFHILFYFM